MNLSEKIQKIKYYFAKASKYKSAEKDILIILIIILVGLISFGLGRLSVISENKTPITVKNLTRSVNLSTSDVDSIDNADEKLFVVSKNGTKYHYPWCSGAQRINEENKIWFNTKEEAEKAGYTPASNCKGL